MMDARLPAHSSPASEGRHRGWLLYVGAAVLYASVFITWTWPLALSADRVAGVPPEHDTYDFFTRNDQFLSIWGASANARALLALDVRRLLEGGTCWPTPNSTALGEHMIELGILATPAFALTHDPLVAYNTACLLIVVIAGLGMLALVREWTGSAVAGLVAGFLYAFHPTRINDLAHPAVIGNHWIPFVLLYFERVLTLPRLRPTLTLMIVAGLACLTGAYPLLTLVSFGVPYAAIRSLQLRRRISWRGVAALALAVAAVAVLVAPLLLAYKAAEGTWYSLRPRYTVYLPFLNLLPGHFTSIGVLSLLLAVLAVALHRRRTGEPMVALAVAGLVCALLACEGPIWPGGPSLRSLYAVLVERMPLLDAVRAPLQLRVGVYVAVIAMAGIGLGRLLARLGPGLRVVSGAVLIAIAIAEIFYDPIALAVYEKPQDFVLRELRPPAEVLAAYAAFDEHDLPGPILDVPYNATWGQWAQMPKYVLYAAYHGRRTAACYNSFLPPTYDNADRLASRLTRFGNAEEAAAAGFHNVVWHHIDGGPLPPIWMSNPQMRILRQSAYADAVLLDTYPPIHEDRDRLKPLRLFQNGEINSGLYNPRLYLGVENRGAIPWAHPAPVMPIEASLVWVSEGAGAVNGVRHEIHVPIMLPLSLVAGQEDDLPVPVLPLPAPGTYRVTLEVPALGWTITTQELVTVG